MARKLRAPSGTDECNWGEQRFPVDNDGTVSVPDEAVASLTHDAGFVEIDIPAAIVPEGFVKAICADGVDAISWGGSTYRPDANGVFMVPAASIIDIAPHGFSPVEV